jgi:hypothetical protein
VLAHALQHLAAGIMICAIAMELVMNCIALLLLFSLLLLLLLKLALQHPAAEIMICAIAALGTRRAKLIAFCYFFSYPLPHSVHAAPNLHARSAVYRVRTKYIPNVPYICTIRTTNTPYIPYTLHLPALHA